MAKKIFGTTDEIDGKKIKGKRSFENYFTINKGKKPRKDYNLLKDIRQQKVYKNNVEIRDVVAREYLEKIYENKNQNYILPGQLVMFNYFEPKTKDILEYYDAMPLVIFFGVHKTEQGRRIIGFNIHYYPPKIRYRVMNRIYEIFKPFYLKSFNKPITIAMEHFDYKWLMKQLEDAKLDFGIRQYDPSLCRKIIPIPMESWAKAVFTEGHFKKETRLKILDYWRGKRLEVRW